jgi:hexosaminidase
MPERADPDLPLFPRPQRLRWRAGRWVLPSQVVFDAPAALQVAPAWEWIREALQARGHRLERSSAASSAVHFRVALVPSPGSAISSQRHALTVGPDGLWISCSDSAGLQAALATVAQLLTLAEGRDGQLELPWLELEDWPDFPVRGVMLDVSRDKVPELRTLYALVDRLARWKLNQLQLYMEHTFAYPGHERVWRDASAFTPEEVRALDAYCAERHIELVPNQNSFGHMQRWLVHEPYRALAECPEGFEHPWSPRGEPYGLCATDPASLVFLRSLYSELLPNFRSHLFNVGLDETLDLGHGRSREACAARGTERVYLEFLQAVQRQVHEHGHVMQFWGDIIVKRPDLIAELPRDAIALEWGYEADHPFAEHLALFRAAGLDFYVCPGTSSWNSIAGRTENAIANLALAAREGKAAGAVGLLITDWGDHGHLQPLCVSYLGLLLGAGFAWNVADAERPFEIDVPRLLDLHVFHDSNGVLGRVAHDLGNAYREAGSPRANASVLFWSVVKPERLFSPAGVTQQTLERTLRYVQRVSEPLLRAHPTSAEGELCVRELGWARDLLCFACRLGILRCSLADRDALTTLPVSERAELADELRELIGRHRTLWSLRNRPGGLDDSASRLEETLRALCDERPRA